MATTTPNFGWTVPTSTDLVKDGATAIETLGDSIDASFVGLKGGTTGQVLSKTSGTDLAFTWVAQDDSNAIQNAIVDAKGDLIAATAADTPARLAVGTNGQILTADSTAATGIKWAAAPTGKILQVVSATKTDTFTTTSTSFVDVTGYSASITPTSATSTILVLYNLSGMSTDGALSHSRLLRGSTVINVGAAAGSRNQSTSDLFSNSSSCIGTTSSGSFLDSPATTSATIYKMQVTTSGGTVYVNRSNTDNDTFNRSRTVSTITLMEIGA
jgi:hypothetical protein